MAGRHKVLIVEDDEATAEDLGEVLRSIGCDSVVVATHQAASLALQDDGFCLILLDLQIKSGSDGIKGNVEHGKSLLREIRQVHRDHTGRAYWLPVLIVSGFANEVPVALEVMEDGASGVIQKPLSSQDVSARVRRALETSGRLTHDRCSENGWRTKRIARAEADNKGANLWAEPTVRFLDPVTKSGVFLREITSRLTEGLKEQIPDLQKRVDHILTQQVLQRPASVARQLRQGTVRRGRRGEGSVQPSTRPLCVECVFRPDAFSNLDSGARRHLASGRGFRLGGFPAIRGVRSRCRARAQEAEGQCRNRRVLGRRSVEGRSATEDGCWGRCTWHPRGRDRDAPFVTIARPNLTANSESSIPDIGVARRGGGVTIFPPTPARCNREHTGTRRPIRFAPES